LALTGAVHATPLTLDFTSGVTVGTGNELTSYTEDGFTLVADLAGNHFDDNYDGGAMGFHNGMDNFFDRNTLTLSYGGAEFDVLDIDISSLYNFGRLELTGSDDSYFVSSALGQQVVSIKNVTSVTFSIKNFSDSASSGAAWNGMTVDVASTGNSIPEPTSIALVGLALAGIGFSRKKKAS